MFAMSANSFLLALDMFRSKCIFYYIYIVFFSALQEAHGCSGQLPVYQGWYIASPLSSQAKHQSPSIRKTNPEPVETLSTGPPCMIPPFLPYPYEIYHVQRIIHPNEDMQFPDRLPFEEMENFGLPTNDDGEDYGLEDSVPSENFTDDIRTLLRPESYYLPHHKTIHPQLSVSSDASVEDKPSLQPEESEETVEEDEPNFWTQYINSQAYRPHFGTKPEEPREVVKDEEKDEATDITEKPCDVEHTTMMEDIPETTPLPEVEETEAVVSASAMSQHQQELLNQMHEQYESEDEMTPCDGYFEKNAAALAQMLEQHLDDRQKKGSRSEGSENPDAARLFVPIIKSLKNIIGAFMTTEKPAKPIDSQPTTTEKPEVPKQETTMKTTDSSPSSSSPPPPSSSPPPPPPPAPPTTSATQAPQEAQPSATPEPESGATSEAPKIDKATPSEES